MLTLDDLKAIGNLLDEKLSQYPTKQDLDEKLRTQKTELLVEMSKLRKELLEKMTEQREELLGELRHQKKEIVKDIGDLLHKNLLPLLDKHEKRLEHLERHTHHPPGAPADL